MMALLVNFGSGQASFEKNASFAGTSWLPSWTSCWFASTKRWRDGPGMAKDRGRRWCWM